MDIDFSETSVSMSRDNRKDSFYKLWSGAVVDSFWRCCQMDCDGLFLIDSGFIRRQENCISDAR